METNQIVEKIQKLENWLIGNSDSVERSLIESDIKKSQTLLNKKS